MGGGEKKRRREEKGKRREEKKNNRAPFREANNYIFKLPINRLSGLIVVTAIVVLVLLPLLT